MSIKGTVRVAINRLLAPAGLHICRKVSADRDSRPISPAMIAQAIKCSVPAMQKVAAFFGGVSDPTTIRAQVDAFFEAYMAFRHRQGYGSSGINTLLTLYVAGRSADPALVVESGVFEGFSSWALRIACPGSDMHCYDLTFSHLLYRAASIQYHEHDWASAPPEFKSSPSSLCYFDDHVNQAQRICEAAKRGIRWMVFDDNVSWHTLHRDGLPPIPTVDMVCDELLPDGTRLDWVSATHPMHYTRDKAFDLNVRSLIARYERVPNLHDVTGYPSTPMALVELKQA